MLRSVYRVCGNIRRVKLAIMQYENMTDGGQPQDIINDVFLHSCFERIDGGLVERTTLS